MFAHFPSRINTGGQKWADLLTLEVLRSTHSTDLLTLDVLTSTHLANLLTQEVIDLQGVPKMY